jgi:hypothetical protein
MYEYEVERSRKEENFRQLFLKLQNILVTLIHRSPNLLGERQLRGDPTPVGRQRPGRGRHPVLRQPAGHNRTPAALAVAGGHEGGNPEEVDLKHVGGKEKA